MKVTFCGHGDYIYGDAVKEKLKRTIERLVKEGAETFYIGGYGAFDRMAALIVYELKQKYGKIKSVLVIPYPDRKYDMEYYDESVYPPIETVPKRAAIIKRNEWMADRADIVVAYVDHDWGGAAKTYAYALRKNKEIINLT